MRILSVSVKGLFGLFNHEIPLQSAERVTIIHGPNGFGKTAMLGMIAGLIEGNTAIFETTPFQEFSVTFEDGRSGVIAKDAEERGGEDGGRPGLHQPHLRFLLRNQNGSAEPVPPTSVARKIPPRILMEVDRFVPGPYRLVGSAWVDDSGERYSAAEIIDRFPSAAKALPKKYRPGFFFEAAKDLEVFFVETNRLAASAPVVRDPLHEHSVPAFRPEGVDQPQRPRVEHYSREIARRIQVVLANYARHSQESDRTFPERLVRFVRDGHASLPEKEILGRMSDLESKRRRLISLGLLESESGLRDLTEEDVRRAREALTIYVGDIEQKLNVFDDMARRIGLLMDIINSRFKYKKLTINRDHGFRVLSDLGQNVRLQDLSSGEQHELVVLYELLFLGPRNGLILVDEPEISLHVGWQSRFLSDLINILHLIDAYAIVATHSPVIIGTRSDLTVELEGPEQHVPEMTGSDARVH